jgi:biotin carboxyl carrier protein
MRELDETRQEVSHQQSLPLEEDERLVDLVRESMKMMNEIPADVSGEVVEILVENAEGVEYDQPLFSLRPEK